MQEGAHATRIEEGGRLDAEVLAVQGAAQAEIIEIIDHHRIGTFTTSQPILFRNEPVGSTSTIVADSFFRSRVEMPREIAGLLLAGLVSDTLNLTSPTTTER